MHLFETCLGSWSLGVVIIDYVKTFGKTVCLSHSYSFWFYTEIQPIIDLNL